MADADAIQPSSASTSNINEKSRNSQISKFTVPAPATAKPSIRFMPSYRLEAMRPFNREICEKIMKTVMDSSFANFTYSPKQSLQLCTQVSEEIKNRIKTQNYDRYRLIVVVTVGEKLMQGYYSLVNFLWDAEKDGYLSYAIDTPKLFAVATLYYLYCD